MYVQPAANAMRLFSVGPGEPGRAPLERHIHATYARAYGADIDHFLPYLIGLDGADSHLLGAMGLRPATERGLFLEQYLDVPAELALGERIGSAVPRAGVVELGNLAAGTAGAARLMIVALSAYLRGAGFQWVVFTAVPALRNAFTRIGLELVELGPADGARLGSAVNRWGRYYEQRPVVVASNVARGYAAVERHVAMEQALVLLRGLWHCALAEGRAARVGGGAA